MLFLFGCSNKNNKYKAWNETYWGMPEHELLSFISTNNQSSQINKSECSKDYLKNQKLDSCSFISLKNYSIGNQHYTISFRLNNNHLSFINLNHDESSDILGQNHSRDIDTILNQQEQMKEVGWAASLELYKLLNKKYGKPTTEDISKGDSLKFKAIWNTEYTIIELKNPGILPRLTYKPNNEKIYLETIPNDVGKI